jgi:hypothetical protein
MYTYIIFFCKYIYIIHRNTQTQYKQTCLCTQMFARCGNRTLDLLRSRRVFPPLRHIGHNTYTKSVVLWTAYTYTRIVKKENHLCKTPLLEMQSHPQTLGHKRHVIEASYSRLPPPRKFPSVALRK